MDLMYVPVTVGWRLNERHYGGLQVSAQQLSYIA
jgi:bisphosphoglycerate-dependent phosphoglycerate mutase